MTGTPNSDAADRPGPEPAAPLAVEIVELDEVRVAAVRSVVAPEDVPDFMADALGMVDLALRRAGVAPTGPPFARYFGMGTHGLDVAAGFPVAEPFPGAEVVHPGALPAGPAAVATYIGPFEGLEAAWGELRRRIETLGRRRGEDPWEVYVVGPGSGVDDAAWRTELIWPLEPEGPGESGGTGTERRAGESGGTGTERRAGGSPEPAT